MLENMDEGTNQNENTAQVYILGLYCNPIEKQQEGSSWTGAHEEFQYGESDAGAWIFWVKSFMTSQGHGKLKET